MSTYNKSKKYKIRSSPCDSWWLLEVEGEAWCYEFPFVYNALEYILMYCDDNLINSEFYSESHMLHMMSEAGYKIEIEE